MRRLRWHSFTDCSRSSSGDRLFKPADHYDDGAVEIELACAGWNFVRCSAHSGHRDGIVIAVDGACRNNGSTRGDAAMAAYGVFVAPGSAYNKSCNLPGVHASSQKAELKAGIAALETALCIAQRASYFRSTPLRQVVVKADSAYLVHGITDWIDKWRRNGFRNVRRDSVANGDYFRQLDELVDCLERRGVEVHFWHVKRENNCEADRLANEALDQRRG
jgi:ribonuclease HI